MSPRSLGKTAEDGNSVNISPTKAERGKSSQLFAQLAEVIDGSYRGRNPPPSQKKALTELKMDVAEFKRRVSLPEQFEARRRLLPSFQTCRFPSREDRAGVGVCSASAQTESLSESPLGIANPSQMAIRSYS